MDQTDPRSESHVETFVPEPAQHHHPGHGDFRVQVRAPGHGCTRPWVSEQHSGVPADGGWPSSCLGGPTNVRDRMAGGGVGHPYELEIDFDPWTDDRCSDLL